MSGPAAQELRALWERRGALAAAFALAAIGAWLMGLPAMGVARRSGLANLPAAEARLFDSQGLLLLEVLRESADAWGDLRFWLQLSSAAVVLLSPLALAAWCLSAPDEPREVRSTLFVDALRAYPAALSAAAWVWLLRALLLLVGALVAGGLRTRVDGTNDPLLDVAAFVALACAIAGIGATPPLRDLAIIHAIRENAGPLASLRVGWSVFCRSWRPLLVRLSLLYWMLGSLLLLGLSLPHWFSRDSSGVVVSLSLALGTPVALALCIVTRASGIEQARRAHHRWRMTIGAQGEPGPTR